VAHGQDVAGSIDRSATAPPAVPRHCCPGAATMPGARAAFNPGAIMSDNMVRHLSIGELTALRLRCRQPVTRKIGKDIATASAMAPECGAILELPIEDLADRTAPIRCPLCGEEFGRLEKEIIVDLARGLRKCSQLENPRLEFSLRIKE
jgi:hypothetical protein